MKNLLVKDFVGECQKYWNGTIQAKVIKESLRKEESHVDVSTRAGNHSRGNGACGASSKPPWERLARPSTRS